MKVSIIVTKKKQYTQVQHTRGLAVRVPFILPEKETRSFYLCKYENRYCECFQGHDHAT